MGIQAASAPISIAEYSSPKHRGAFLATIAFSFATGMLIAHVFGTLLYWRTAAIACGSCYLLSLILITLSPETPPYLASKGLTTECRKSFRWFRGNDPNSEKELAVLLNSQKVQIVSSKKVQEPWFKRLRVMVKKPEFYKPTLIMMFMFIMFQVSGMTVIPSYTGIIMDDVTGKSIEASVSMLIVDIVRFVSAVIACIIVNRYPRRLVLFLGICITVSALLVTSLMLYLREKGLITEEYKWTPVIPCLIYIFGKTIGILPIPWAIAGEIFPLAYRSLGSGISGMFLSLMFFLVVKTAPATFRAIGVNGIFCIYGLAVAICGVFLYFLLPETRGKTLYEIECHFRGIQPEDLPNVEEEGKMLELQKVEGG